MSVPHLLYLSLNDWLIQPAMTRSAANHFSSSTRLVVEDSGGGGCPLGENPSRSDLENALSDLPGRWERVWRVHVLEYLC